jgi:hypothetical protein
MLLDLLSDRGWELVSRDGDTDWWVEEHWLIRSARESWGQELTLSFLVAPDYEGHIKSRAIWAIGATVEKPEVRFAVERGIAFTPLVKGQFKKCLRSLVGQLDEHRHRAVRNGGARCQ